MAENWLVIKKVIGNLCESDLNVVGREKTPKEWVLMRMGVKDYGLLNWGLMIVD